MVLYRDHRGSFSQAMKTVREVKNLTEIKEHINQSWGMEVEAIRVKPYGFDFRNRWDTHIVICKFVDGMEIPVGFTNKYIK